MLEAEDQKEALQLAAAFINLLETKLREAEKALEEVKLERDVAVGALEELIRERAVQIDGPRKGLDYVTMEEKPQRRMKEKEGNAGWEGEIEARLRSVESDMAWRKEIERRLHAVEVSIKGEMGKETRHQEERKREQGRRRKSKKDRRRNDESVAPAVEKEEIINWKDVGKLINDNMRQKQEREKRLVEMTENPFPIEDLPPELFWKVLSYLTMAEWYRCKLVCKQWQHVIDEKTNVVREADVANLEAFLGSESEDDDEQT